MVTTKCRFIFTGMDKQLEIIGIIFLKLHLVKIPILFNFFFDVKKRLRALDVGLKQLIFP